MTAAGSTRTATAVAAVSRADVPTLVVIPTYNERENVESLVTLVLSQRPGIDVWIADDNSPDGTGDVVRQLMTRWGRRLSLVEGKAKRGRGAAVIAAFRQGLLDPMGYRVFFEMDADHSHDPRAIPAFFDRLETNDMVIGSRYVEGGSTSEWGHLRPLLSKLANLYVACVAGIPVRDTTSGYRAYRRRLLEAIDFDRILIQGYAVHGEIAYQAWVNGFRIGETPISFRNRRRDLSKLTLREIVSAWVNFGLLRLRYGWRRKRRDDVNDDGPAGSV
jgi:dolichol-phosphate mannosyltransferase